MSEFLKDLVVWYICSHVFFFFWGGGGGGGWGRGREGGQERDKNRKKRGDQRVREVSIDGGGVNENFCTLCAIDLHFPYKTRFSAYRKSCKLLILAICKFKKNLRISTNSQSLQCLL